MSATRTMRVNKWGNSLGIRLPGEFADIIDLKEKSIVEIAIEGNKLIITKVRDDIRKPTIQELFEIYPADYIEDEEIDWGTPVGGELW